MAKKPKKEKPQSTEIDNKFKLLLTLITLLRSARHKNKKTELEFLMVNQTFNLVPYSSCIYWEYDKGKIVIKNVSGLVQIDSDSPYNQWLSRVIKHYISNHKSKDFDNNDNDEAQEQENSFSKLSTITQADCHQNESGDWKKWVTDNAFIVIMRDDNNKGIIGGLWIDKDQDLASLEKALLEDLGDGYAHILQKFKTKNQRNKSPIFSFFSSAIKTKLFFLALLLIMLIPVKMSATAPAEVVANKPNSINIPFDGVIDTIEVSPGQEVKAGDVLLKMDSTLLENKVTMTNGELRAAEISLQKTERESMKDRTKLSEIAILKSRLIQKRAEVSFAREMLELAEIKAERDGIVIFADANSLRGRPVQTGEQVMQLADLNDIELMIRIPVSAMIKIDTSEPARFFLNVNPFDSQKLKYETIGYQASIDAGGLMTYKIRGKFIEPNNDIRIGWTGTGKVYGERTFLIVNLLRRPITTLRRKLGI